MIQLYKSYFDELNKEKIQNLVSLSHLYFDFRKELYRRYSRKDSPTSIVKGSSSRGAVMFEYYIVNFAQGYLSGKPPAYTVKKSEISDAYQDAIEDIRRYNDDAATFTELIHDYLITASAYLYITENEKNEIVYTRLDSRNTICIYDYGTPPYPIALLKVWTETDEKNNPIERIEIITANSRRIYDGSGNAVMFDDYGEDGRIQSMIEKPLFWGDVPVVPFENPDSVAVFEPAVWLIDTYENLLTNIRNMTQYNDNAKLKISGYNAENEATITIDDGDGNTKTIPNPARQTEERALYEAACLFLQEGGDVTWLIKNVSYSGILSILKQLHDNITMLTGVPNMTDEAFSSANNASALGYKLYALDQYSATVDRIFKKGYLRLWEVITNRLNLKGADYNFRNIDIKFSRNIPTDDDKDTQRAITAYKSGIISLKTAIEESAFDVDSENEIARIETEKAGEFDAIQERLKQSQAKSEGTPDEQ